jgi:peptidoglycan/LPS O-acetylase OafA/YrhL
MLHNAAIAVTGSAPDGALLKSNAEGHGAVRYRPDVDGLRAVAVTAVVAFHAGFRGVPGGFTGVDVFFVISGYLIGAQIFRQSSAGSFRYLPFYARRLRRIVPALIALLLALFVLSYFLLTPSEMRELGKESVAAVIGASNVLFYLNGDYFAPAADLNPLLHTWSLGVEEQFYIFLPILAVVLIRVLKAPATKSLLIVTALSLAGSIVLLQLDSSAAFYLLPTRFWELSLGALLATSGSDNSVRLQGRLGQTLGVGGVALILVGILCYRPQFGFPGAYALLPTVGAAMLIVTRTSWINRFALANPVMVFIGKVSYSWYLWHWPVFYLVRVLEVRVHPAVLAVLSLVLGVLSWHFVEQPFRRRRRSDGRTVLSYVAAILCVATVGALVYQQDGFPARLPGKVQAAAEEAQQAKDDPCLLRRGSLDIAPAGCQFASSGMPTVALIGDSHGASISPGFAHISSKSGLAFRQLTKSLCTGQWGYANPVSDVQDFATECLAYQKDAFGEVAHDPNIKVVVLASRWSLEQQLVTASGAGVFGLEVALESTVTRLEKQGRMVVLVQDAPAFLFDPYSAVIGAALPLRADLQRAFGKPASTGSAPFSRMEKDTSRQILVNVAARHPNVVLFDPWLQLCDTQGCRYEAGDDLYYFDNQHLTAAGALRAVGAALQLLTAIDKKVHAR